jgi:hypothetical protein
MEVDDAAPERDGTVGGLRGPHAIVPCVRDREIAAQERIDPGRRREPPEVQHVMQLDLRQPGGILWRTPTILRCALSRVSQLTWYRFAPAYAGRGATGGGGGGAATVVGSTAMTEGPVPRVRSATSPCDGRSWSRCSGPSAPSVT